jgi:hypothetical protein
MRMQQVPPGVPKTTRTVSLCEAHAQAAAADTSR